MNYNSGLVLVQKRAPGGGFGGLWEFPGGKVEDGETMRAALGREWEEELGLKIDVGRLITEIVLPFSNVGNVLLPLFEVNYENQTPVPRIEQTIDMVEVGQLSQLAGVPSLAVYMSEVKGWADAKDA